MDWNDARLCDSLAYDLKLADYPRGRNRSLLNNLYNGLPPYTDDEVQENAIDVNVNFLEGTRLLHDARAQFYQNFMKPGKYFTLATDYGPKHRRQHCAATVTRHMNRIMKRSLRYYETMRAKGGLLILHGIAPAIWQDQYSWCPKPIGVEDSLVPSNTLLGFDNLPFIMIYRSFTGYELKKLTREGRRDPGWNMPLVNSLLEYIDKEGTTLMGSNWPEIWSPEKMAERIKGDGGFYATDQLPTIDCFDIYAYDESQKESGWIRRIILDAWGQPAASGKGYTMSRKDRGAFDRISHDDFLYTSKKRKIADSLQSIVSFQFADLSAVAPFRYHSVRSLGFLEYAVCHLQNRMRCKFNESVFEALMQYFRVKNLDDAQRALKVELVNKGFIEEGINLVPASERWQVNANLVELGLQENKQLITENASSSVQNSNFSRDRVEKTRFQVMAEVNASQAMISAGMMQAFMYQTFEYREIARRFMCLHSKDPDVLEFRAACLKDKVPEEMLSPERWEVNPERVVGSGNKTLELAISEQLMAYRPLYDPDAQRKILRNVTMNMTDDPALSEELVPYTPTPSNSVRMAQLAAGSLMHGLPVSVDSGINLGEYAQAILADMAILVAGGQQGGGMIRPEELKGLMSMSQHVKQVLQMMSQDESAQQELRTLGQQLGNLDNFIKGFAQRLNEQMQAQQENGNGMAPEDVAKLQLKKVEGEQKLSQMKESHAQRTAQRQVQFEHEMEQNAARTQAEIAANAAKANQDLAADAAKAEIEIKKSREQAKKPPATE